MSSALVLTCPGFFSAGRRRAAAEFGGRCRRASVLRDGFTGRSRGPRGVGRLARNNARRSGRPSAVLERPPPTGTGPGRAKRALKVLRFIGRRRTTRTGVREQRYREGRRRRTSRSTAKENKGRAWWRLDGGDTYLGTWGCDCENQKEKTKDGGDRRGVRKNVETRKPWRSSLENQGPVAVVI